MTQPTAKALTEYVYELVERAYKRGVTEGIRLERERLAPLSGDKIVDARLLTSSPEKTTDTVRPALPARTNRNGCTGGQNHVT